MTVAEIKKVIEGLADDVEMATVTTGSDRDGIMEQYKHKIEWIVAMNAKPIWDCCGNPIYYDTKKEA